MFTIDGNDATHAAMPTRNTRKVLWDVGLFLQIVNIMSIVRFVRLIFTLLFVSITFLWNIGSNSLYLAHDIGSASVGPHQTR